jgi:uncharacterized protein (TIGR00255 family)
VVVSSSNEEISHVRSMTGHGRGAAESGGRRATVEVRAVNHRFFDLKVRATSGDPRVEERVGAALRRRAERGAFTVSVREESGGAGGGIHIDAGAAKAAAAALEELRQTLGLTERVSLALIAGLPGVIQYGEAAADVEASFPAIDAALEAALDELVEMRRREGATLARDLGARLTRLDQLAAEVKQLAAAAPEEQRRRLQERVTKLVAGSGATVDEARLANELALLADRVDVTEELVRLASHVGQMRALLAEDGAVGRRLDFLTQELGREVNTIGSKSQSAEIAARVVAAKAEIEKIREQVQNVE